MALDEDEMAWGRCGVVLLSEDEMAWERCGGDLLSDNGVCNSMGKVWSGAGLERGWGVLV